MEQNDFIKGALIGGVLGGVAALLLAPKAGKDLRDDLSQGYQLFNKRSLDIADNLKKQKESLIDMLNGEEHSHTHNALLTGGAIGAVIGAIAALLLAPQAGNKLREQLGDKYEEVCHKAEEALNGFNKTRHQIEGKIDDWKDTLLTITEKLSATKHGKSGGKIIDEIVDWADLGLRVYSQLQKRR